jgi:hypothetical protein
VDNLSVASAGQIQTLHEGIARIDLAFPRVAIALRPPLVMAVEWVAV